MKNWIVSFASIMIVGLSPRGPVVCASALKWTGSTELDSSTDNSGCEFWFQGKKAFKNAWHCRC